MNKICSKCKIIKPVDMFYKRVASNDGLQSVCKSCADSKRNEIRNSKWKEYLQYSKDYNNVHRERDRQRKSNYVKERCLKDVQFRISMHLRTRLRNALKKNLKAGSAIRDLGCSIEELKIHLEKLFQTGMTWENYGEWHIDHIVPLISFDLTNREQLLKACHYTNLQPLWAKDNLSKGSKQ